MFPQVNVHVMVPDEYFLGLNQIIILLKAYYWIDYFSVVLHY